MAWWLFPDEHHNADGRRREYLGRRDEWARFDQDLFDALLKIDTEKKKKKLNIRAIEEAALLPNVVFACEPVPCSIEPFSQRPVERGLWLARVKTKLKDCNLIFLDPDNGIAPEGLRLTRRRAGKSVTIDEIKALRESDRAIVVYHHQTHRPGGHCREIYDLAARLTSSGLRVSGALRAKPWSPRVFFILDGDKKLQDRAKNIANCWRNSISWHSDVELRGRHK